MNAAITGWRKRAVGFFRRELWSRDADARPGVAFARRALQIGVLVAEQFVRDQLLLRASALTYYAVLAVVPLLAIALSLVQTLGVREDLARVLVDRVAAGSPEAAGQLLALVERVDFSGLGTLGAALLVLTTILGIQSVERALNGIWGVTRPRSWDRRFPDYLAVLVVAPLLLGVALSLGTTLRSQALVQRLLEVPSFATLYRVGLRQAPTVFLWFAFSFVYWFLPNTRVRVSSALLGGGVAAVLFTLAQNAYVGFSIGAARYNALFGGLAALPLLLVWIYVSWVIVLLGAETAFVHQHLPRLRRARRFEEPGSAAREAIGLELAARIGRAFADGSGGLDVGSLADGVNAPLRSVQEILLRLERAGIASRRAGEGETFQLGRAAETIGVGEILAALRGERAATSGPVEAVLAELEQRQADALTKVTLADLLRGGRDSA